MNLRLTLALLLAACLSILTAGKTHAQNADLFASINHPNPTGPGAIFEYTPTGVQSTFVASVVQPRGLAVDCAGNLFVASTDSDINGNAVGTIFKVTPGGVVSTFTTSFPNNFFLEDIKFDSMGNLFVVGDNQGDPNLAGTIFKVSPGGGVSIFGSVPFQGFGLAFDSMGNLYAASGDPAIYEFTRAGMRSVFAGPAAFTASLGGPVGLAFDASGNLFVSTEGNPGNDSILKFTPSGVETTFATGLPNNPRGLAFDSAGNLFVAEVPGAGGGPGDILKFTPAGVGSVFAAGIGRPQGNGGPEFLAFARPCRSTSSSASNFNGTQINSGSTIWFNSVLSPSGLGNAPVTFRFTNQTISSSSFTVTVPDAQVTFDPAATSATTTFTGGMWVTRVPSTGLAGNTFFSAVSFPVTANIPGGLKNVTWSGTIASDTPTASLQWQWGAAVYNCFSSDNNAVGVKPVDDNKASVYKNSDHAGTPENFKFCVTGGATGGGGSNYTGSYSGTIKVGPCCSH